MQCYVCNSENAPEAIYCNHCGERLQTEQERLEEIEKQQAEEVKHKVQEIIAAQSPSFFMILLSPKGRVGRLAYWSAGVILSVTQAIGITLLESADVLLGVLGGVFMIASIWSAFVVTAKRWHDLDKSAWWSLTFLVPIWNFISGLELLFGSGKSEENIYGHPPVSNRAFEITGVIVFILSIAVVAYILFGDTYSSQLQPASSQFTSATPRPAASPTAKPRPTNTKESCTHWSKVTSSMEGRTMCVYGTVSRIYENNGAQQSYIYFGDVDEFFFLNSYTWSDIVGKCVSHTGTIKLNSVHIPYLMTGDQLAPCP